MEIVRRSWHPLVTCAAERDALPDGLAELLFVVQLVSRVLICSYVADRKGGVAELIFVVHRVAQVTEGHRVIILDCCDAPFYAPLLCPP